MYVDPNTGGILFQILVVGFLLIIPGILSTVMLIQSKFDWKRFTSAKGRIGRQTWWFATLFLYMILFIASVIIGSLTGNDQSGIVSSLLFLVVEILFAAAYIIICVQRLHDLDKSGWYYLIVMIPFVGGLILFIQLGFIKGTVGQNQYGDDPLTTPDTTVPFTQTKASFESSNTTSVPTDKLQKLKDMLDKGLISAQDYETKKTEILSKM
jgi:uncharacterized membrane protein YhaH (DUF805 family)